MNFVQLRISSDSLNPSLLSELFKLKPDFQCSKGEKRIYKNKEILYKESCWIKSIEIENVEDMEEKTIFFLDQFMPFREQISELANNLTITLWITLYPDNQLTNFHISKKIIGMVGKLGISMDISSFFLKDLYEATGEKDNATPKGV